MHGKGKIYYPDKSKYEGDFKNDMKDGHGTLEYPDGRKYVGEFKNDLMHGKGVMTTKNKRPIEGIWEKGQRKKVIKEGHTS